MMMDRLVAQPTFEAAIATLLADVVALHGAEFGDVQLPIGDELVIVARFGLDADFVRAFRRVRSDDGSACGRALRARETVVIADVECDAEYAAFRPDARAAGYRSVQTTPLFTRDGELIGMVSTLFANVHEPTEIEIDALQKYSIAAADYLRSLLNGETVVGKAVDMHARLCDELGVDAHGEVDAVPAVPAGP
jgi:GAF domain-containing protein